MTRIFSGAYLGRTCMDLANPQILRRLTRMLSYPRNLTSSWPVKVMPSLPPSLLD